MVHRALVTTACIMCALIVASFALFVRDQLKTSATHQANLIAPPTRLQYPGTTTTTSTATTPAHHQPGQPRRFIVGAAHDLTSPFDSIVSSRNEWVNQIVPDVLALLVYGGGLGFAARYSRGSVHGHYR